MNDDVKALITEAREMASSSAIGHWERAMIDRLADALQAATVAPAVDREALASVLERFIEGLRAERRLYPDLYRLELSDAVIAHLGARDVRDVQAEALEEAADDIEPLGYGGTVTNILRMRAQAIREARSER